MQAQSTIEIVLHLDSAEDFFTAPELNPLERKAVYEPGVDTIFLQVRASRPKAAIQLTLYLPENGITPGLGQRLEDALNDFCLFQSYRIQQDLHMHFRLGRRTLWVGLIVLAVSLALSSFGDVIYANASNNYSKGLGYFMSNGFMIIGWVSLWTPVAMLLYDWWPDRVNQRTYERMAKMTIDIHPEPPAN